MASNPLRIGELQRELAGNPGSRQFYQLGELLRREGRAADAVPVLRSGLRHHPRYVAAWVSLGRAFLETGQAKEAVLALDEALGLDAANPVAWRLIGEARLALGSRLEALDAWQKALELVPGDPVLEAAVDELARATVPPSDALAQVAERAAAPAEEPAWAESLPEPIADPFGEPAPLPAPDAASLGEIGGDVFAIPETASPAPGVALADAERTSPAGEAREEPLASSVPEPQPIEGAPATASAVAVMAEVDEAQAAPGSRESAEPPPGPPATVTLARLYLHQQQHAAALATLERVLEEQPGNQEARDLLDLVREMLEPLPAPAPPLPRRERKIAALQRWLACLTLAREQVRR